MGQTESNKSKSTSKSESRLSSLAETQETMIGERNTDYREYYLPEFKNYFNSLEPDSDAGKAQMGLTAQQINTSFDSAQKQTDQAIARQNLGKSGAGIALTTANNRARSSALASAYANQMAQSNTNKGNALAQLGQLMPQTTTAAPVLVTNESTSKGTAYTNLLSGYII